MNRSRMGTDLYCDKDDYVMFHDLIQETSAMYHLNVAAYCLMPNHYHLLVQSSEGNLSRCMRHLNGIYTQKFNSRHKCDGTLFRGRYKSVLVQDDSYSSVGSVLERVNRKMTMDKKFRKRVMEIKEKLLKGQKQT